MNVWSICPIARNSLGWKSLEERRVEMKARIMYKIVNMLAPSRLCDLFENVNKIADYSLRGSSTRICIQMPKNRIPKKISVMIEERRFEEIRME